MKKLALGLIVLFACSKASAQSIEELYNERDFQELIKFEDKADELTVDQLYCVGYAFFQLENDKKAIEMYDKAIEKGLDDDYIYLYKGLALRYDGQHEKAVKTFKKAIERNPKGQKNYTELANSFYFRKQYDSALVYFYKARELDYELGDPYLKIPNIYHVQDNYDRALEEYKISASLIDKEDPKYVEIIKSIGQLEYTVFKRFDKSIEAYSEMLSLVPENYDLYPKLIKAFYANEEYARGDSLFYIMKAQYEKGGLSKEYQQYGSVALDEFEWNGQRVTTYRYFKDATETLDIAYKVYLLSKDGQSVERTLMTERTIPIGEDGPVHLLCEREKSGVHHTFPFGWSSEEIAYSSLKSAAIRVFEGEITPSASSNFGISSGKKKKKKKRK